MTLSRRDDEILFGGVALWRRIADALRLDIVGGKFARGDKLPAETALAERFGVNRHTVRRALAALASEDVVRTEQGRGSFVGQARRLSYRIGKRTRFSEGLAGQARQLQRDILATKTEVASATIAKALRLRPSSRVLRIETVSLADASPISRATSWFEFARFPGLAEQLQRSRSITTALRHYGIGDYSRASTHISARHADADETRLLKLAPGAILLVSEALDVDTDQVPIQYAISRFPADRLELVV